jgi:hypothetical protein
VTLVENFVVEKKIDVAAVTEIWLPQDELGEWILKDCTPRGYKSFHAPRISVRGGGLAFIYRAQRCEM